MVKKVGHRLRELPPVARGGQDTESHEATILVQGVSSWTWPGWADFDFGVPAGTPCTG